jgi:hypothetical protein
MAVDYLKTYLGIDPNDYSSMEARIRGEEPQAQSPLMMRQPMMMPQQKSLGDIEAMQLIPRQQPAPQPAPQVDDRYQGLMDQIAALRSQIEGMQAPTEQAPVGAEAPVMADTPTEVNMDDAREMFYQSPEFKEYQRQTEGMAYHGVQTQAITQTQRQEARSAFKIDQDCFRIGIKKLTAEI